MLLATTDHLVISNGNGVLVASQVLPFLDNTYAFGGASNRWTALWAVNGAIQTSDLREKEVIGSLPDDCLGIVNGIDPIRYRWREGADKRTHWGFGAQHVRQALGEQEFAGLTEHGESGPIGLNYAEMQPILWKAVQELAAEVQALKARGA